MDSMAKYAIETHSITHVLGKFRVLLHKGSCSLLELCLGEDVRDEAPVETLLRTHWLPEEKHLGGLKKRKNFEKKLKRLTEKKEKNALGTKMCKNISTSHFVMLSRRSERSSNFLHMNGQQKSESYNYCIVLCHIIEKQRAKVTLEVPIILSNTTDDVPSGHTPRVGKGVEMYVWMGISWAEFRKIFQKWV